MPEKALNLQKSNMWSNNSSMNMKIKSQLLGLRRVFLSSLGALVILLILTAIGNFIWVLSNESEELQETLRQYFIRSMIVSTYVIGIQSGVLFIAGIIFLCIRGRYSIMAGFLSAVVLFFLDVFTIEIGLLNHSRATAMIVILGLPFIVTAFQFCPELWKSRTSISK